MTAADLPFTDADETSPFPGHPLCIALRIVQAYPSLAAALQGVPTHPPTPAALINSRIRGAGGNVHAALDTLKYWLTGHSEYAVEAAKRYWQVSAAPFGSDRVSEGSRLADAALPLLRERLQAWPEH